MITDEYIKLKAEEEKSAKELISQIDYNKDRFVSKFNEDPKSVTISMEDYANLVRCYALFNTPIITRHVELKIFGMKILRSPDLESGEFYLSPHHLL